MLQHDLLDQLDQSLLHTENAPSLDLEVETIGIIKQCLRNSGLQHETFVRRINLCLRESGREITVTQINKWLAPSQQNTFPFWLMPAICWALQTIEPYIHHLRLFDYKVVDSRADKLMRIAQLDIEAKEKAKLAREEREALTRTLTNMERGSNV